MIYVYGNFDDSADGILEKIALVAAESRIKTAVCGEGGEDVSARLKSVGADTDNLFPFDPAEAIVGEIEEKIMRGDTLVTDLSGDVETTKFVVSAAKKKRAKVVLAFPGFAISEAVASEADIAIFSSSSAEKITGFTTETEVGVALTVGEFYSLGLKSAVIFTESDAIAAFGNDITYYETKNKFDKARFVVSVACGLADGKTVCEATKYAIE